jgi:hypothetical protein
VVQVGRVPAWQVQSPEFKPQSNEKIKTKINLKNHQ